MIAKIIFILILTPQFIRAQSVEPLDSLLAAIMYHNNTALQEQINLLHHYKEKNGLSLLPSIGYDLITNRPLVNFSFSNFILLNQRKKDLQFQVLQLKVHYRNQLNNDTITCRIFYHEFNELLENYTGHLLLLDSSFQLLQIKEKENIKIRASTEDVLKIKLELEKMRLSLNQTRNSISAKALQLSLLIKRQIQYKLKLII